MSEFNNIYEQIPAELKPVINYLSNVRVINKIEPYIYRGNISGSEINTNDPNIIYVANQLVVAASSAAFTTFDGNVEIANEDGNFYVNVQNTVAWFDASLNQIQFKYNTYTLRNIYFRYIQGSRYNEAFVSGYRLNV